MKKILLSLTPDIILGLLKFLHSILAVAGLMSKPKEPEKESKTHVVDQEVVEEEIDSIFNLADENALPQGDDVWEPTDLDDIDNVESDLSGINRSLFERDLGDNVVCFYLKNDERIEAIKSVRTITGWKVDECKKFIDRVEQFDLVA